MKHSSTSYTSGEIKNELEPQIDLLKYVPHSKNFKKQQEQDNPNNDETGKDDNNYLHRKIHGVNHKEVLKDCKFGGGG